MPIIAGKQRQISRFVQHVRNQCVGRDLEAAAFNVDAFDKAARAWHPGPVDADLRQEIGCEQKS
jgi:hypothetical protein